MCCLGEYCSWQRLQLSCAGSSLLVIRRAIYGRPRASRCITAQYMHSLGCHSDVTAYLGDVTAYHRDVTAYSRDVTAYLDDVCSGRRHCSLLVSYMDSVAQPCPKDFKSYLDISYDCVNGTYDENQGRSDGGYIGSYTPKISPSKLLWGKMTSERLFNSFISLPPEKKLLYPQNKFLATPLMKTLK